MKTTEMSNQEKIAVLIRARYPLIHIVSSEEKRVETCLRKLVAEQGKTVYLWSITEGWEEPDGTRSAELREPLKVLGHIMETDFKGLVLLKDFHPFIEDPVILRKLRDLARALKISKKNIILLSPVQTVPKDIEKEMTIVEFDLPDKSILDKIITEITQTLPLNHKLTAEKREKIIEASLGLTSEEAENVFAKSLVQKGDLDISVILSEKEQIIRKSGVLEYYHAHEKMVEIGGLDLLKTWLKKRSSAFTREAREFGLPEPKGILLLGIPGCGKSLTAKAISALWQLPLLRLDVGKVFSSLVGSSEENVREAIQTAESIAPSILWLDELEKGFSGMGSSGMSDGGTSARVFGTFLTWLQEKTSPVFVVATSNNISSLPAELLRKGRFDEIFFIDLPQKRERSDIFKIHIEKRRRKAGDFDLEELAANSAGYSGSEIEEAVISALYDAFDMKDDLKQSFLLESLKTIIPLSQTMNEEIKEIRNWADLRARKASSLIQEEQQTQSRILEM